MKQIQIECDPLYDSPDLKYCQFLIKNILITHQVTDADVTIIFGSDRLISDLKKRFFQLDQWTDVISFRLNDYSQSNLEGEIYISLPMTRENAKKYSEPYERELTRLIIHGTLHLLGYKDTQEIDKYKMSEMEEHYLKKTQWKNLFGV